MPEKSSVGESNPTERKDNPDNSLDAAVFHSIKLLNSQGWGDWEDSTTSP